MIHPAVGDKNRVRGGTLLITARIIIGLGAVTGLIGVAVGAFGAHALRASLDAHMLSVYHTGVQYHLVHALALVLTGILMHLAGPSPWLTAAALAFALGIVVFSGSLYLLAVSDQRWFGAITPIGGIAFICGWAALALAMLRWPA
ncbi:MAG: DUF423 domain-containing protein [Gammaproteobacteria bacterium]|nr:DUF423 domain-containing protein [Gammaproteobacteria bacterium]